MLPDYARNKSGAAPRRFDVLFQEAMGGFSDIAGPRKGPGAAFVIGGAGGTAGLFALAALHLETAVVAAGPVDRRFDRAVARFHHAGAAHARNATIVGHERRHGALQPAHRIRRRIVRIVETPGPAAAIALAQQCAIGGIGGSNRRAHIVTARPIEI